MDPNHIFELQERQLRPRQAVALLSSSEGREQGWNLNPGLLPLFQYSFHAIPMPSSQWEPWPPLISLLCIFLQAAPDTDTGKGLQRIQEPLSVC